MTGNQNNYKFLQDSFTTEQELLITKLKSSDCIAHQGDKGETNEQHFIDFLRKYLPDRYTVEKAKVLDSEGNVSHSIDIVVFDRQYTPTLLDNDKHRYVPAEAVYAVFECKHTMNKSNLEYAAEKIESVRKLKRTSVKIHHVDGISPPKPLFRIVGGILTMDVEWIDGLGISFFNNHKRLTGNRSVDCGFAAMGESFDIFSDENNFCYTFGPKKNSLAYFAFRLLWKLQTLATVPATDWMAYAEKLRHSEPDNASKYI